MEHSISSLAGASFFAFASLLSAQIPAISPPKIVAADKTISDGWFREVSVAASPSHTMVVFMHQNQFTGTGGEYMIEYALYGGREWKVGVVDDGFGGTVPSDPSVAYDKGRKSFVILYQKSDAAGQRAVFCNRFKIGQGFLGETQAFNPISQSADKPWIAAGQNSKYTGEFYMINHRVGGFAGAVGYSRTLDGGATWSQGPRAILVDASGNGFSSTFCAQPSVADTEFYSHLFVAYTVGSQWRIIDHDDLFSANGDPIGNNLLDETGSDLGVTRNEFKTDLKALVPGSLNAVKTVPFLAADPTSERRLYLVYQDTAAGSTTDIDVFCARLEYTEGSWATTQIIRVNDDIAAAGQENDQFQPAAIVDHAGRVHVIFFDDRDHLQSDADSTAVFEAYYAYSIDHGNSFHNVRLTAASDEPTLDFNLRVDHSLPGEYPGLVAVGNTVWAAYSGSSSQVSSLDQSVVLVTRIRF